MTVDNPYDSLTREELIALVKECRSAIHDIRNQLNACDLKRTACESTLLANRIQLPYHRAASA